MEIETKNKLYYVKNELLVEYKIIANNIEQAIEKVKIIEQNKEEIIEAKLLENNVYIGV